MKPFIDGEIDRLEAALKALKLCKQKIRIAMELEHSHPITSLKTAGQAEKHMAEYEQAKKEICKAWESEEK